MPSKPIKKSKGLFTHFRLFFVLGSLSVFGSWVMENFQENKFRSEREHIELQQTSVMQMINARRAWEVSVDNHVPNKDGSTDTSRNYNIQVYNYIETSLNAITLIDEIIVKDRIKLDSLKKEIAETLIICANAVNDKDYDKLIAIANYMNMPKHFDFLGHLRNNGGKVKEMLTDLSKKEDCSNNLHLFLYCLGAILLAADFLIIKFNNLAD